MPALTGTALTRWRSHPQMVRGFLYLHVGSVVFDRRVNMPSGLTYPRAQVTYDNPDGHGGLYTDVAVGTTVKVLDGSTSVFKGWAYIRKAATATTLYIGPVGQGDLNLADNDRLQVLDDYRLHADIPNIDGTTGVQYKRYDLAYGNQNTYIPPLANCTWTTPTLFVDDSDVITVTLDATGSRAIADGASLSSSAYTWDLGDGTRTVGGLHDSQITATFPAGVRYVTLTLTDSNGRQSVKRLLIPAFTGEDDPLLYPCQVSRRGGSAESGWEASFSLLAANASAFPEGAPVLYFEAEYFGNTTGPLDGHCVKFTGWVSSQTTSIQPLTSGHVVNAKGPLGILAERPAFPQTVERAASPAAWHQVKGLDWWKAVFYLLYWHSNALELCNLERPAFYADYPALRLDADAGTLVEQITFLAKAARARFTCDARGDFYLRAWPQLMPASERAALTTTVTLVDSDWSEEGLELEYRDADDVAWVRGSAIVASTSVVTAVLSIAPGTTPGQGVAIETLDRQLVVDQADLNARTGHYYAWRNSRRDGQRTTRQLRLPLLHRGDVFDPAWMEWVKFTLAASSNRRGLAFSGTRFVLSAVECTYDHEAGVSAESLTLEEETSGAPGVTQVVPVDAIEDSPLPETVDDPPQDFIPTDPTAIPPDLVYALTQWELRRSRDFTSDPPTWSSNLFSLPGGFTFFDFALDLFDPKNKAYAVIASATEVRLIGTATLENEAPTWDTLQTWSYAIRGALLQGTIVGQGTWFLALAQTDDHVHVLHSHDAWANATVVENVSFANGTGPALAVSANAASLVLVGYGKGYPESQFGLNRSSNWGASFASYYRNYNDFAPTLVALPWQDEDHYVYLAHQDFLLRSANGGVTWADISPVTGASDKWGGRRENRATRNWTCHVTNTLKQALVGWRPTIPHPTPRFFISENRGDSWTDKGEMPEREAKSIGSWPYDEQTYFVSGGAKLLYTTDDGDTWAEKQWATYADGIWCVPVWIE